MSAGAGQHPAGSRALDGLWSAVDRTMGRDIAGPARSSLVRRLAILNVATISVATFCGIVTVYGVGGLQDHGRLALGAVAFAMLAAAALTSVQCFVVARPILRLVAAVEIHDRKAQQTGGSDVVTIPDFSTRRDEIGRLSSALKEMVSALYARIDVNERFAADVAHEIRNPLASLRSAAGSLRAVSAEVQRETLLAIVEEDINRLDRLVTDISSASRLDRELVRGEQKAFDLSAILLDLTAIHDWQARAKGVSLIADLPEERVTIFGLENRLAQVFVNLVSNAISFCKEGDKIRIWSRHREGRVLVVVEDTGPGIPPQAVARIFERFYSERPPDQFGRNSGLGLAISKQIVEAHGGVIWAENIHAPDDPPMAPSRGARIVVGLPVQP